MTIDYWDCLDSEVLTHDSIDGAIEAWIESTYPQPIDKLPAFVEVTGYVRRTIDTEWLIGRSLEPLLECLDEEYGHLDRDLTEPTMVMKAVERMFIETVVSEYEVWQCEAVKTIKVDVTQWLKDNRPMTGADNCQICFGRRGGVRGNENLVPVGGTKITMCDYCHADHLRRERELR